MTNHYTPIGAQLPCESRTAGEPRRKGLVRLLLMLGVLVFYAFAL
jgi:hypothetical protein